MPYEWNINRKLKGSIATFLSIYSLDYMLITYREHVEKQGRKEEKKIDFVYIFLLRNNDRFIEFTFALEPNKVNI